MLLLQGLLKSSWEKILPFKTPPDTLLKGGYRSTMKRDPNFDYNRLIVGYHGCDRKVAESVLLHGELLHASENPYDWLGRGVYFWEHGPNRAYEFAVEQQGRGKAMDPFVLGAYLHLGQCFDLTDIDATSQLVEVYPVWLDTFIPGSRPPENKRTSSGGPDLLLRYADCAFLNWYLLNLDEDQEEDVERDQGRGRKQSAMCYQTVRGVFTEGKPIFPDSGIYEKTHVQIAVRDPSCILGYFRPVGRSEES